MSRLKPEIGTFKGKVRAGLAEKGRGHVAAE